uniref:protein spire homolog 1-like n=1 Tax=Pristiophorus japonicus TaxID=55135 RepID=UPI00398F64F6
MAVQAPLLMSLQELLAVRGQPVTEEQAWALCYQGCRAIQQQQQSLANNWSKWLMNRNQPLLRAVDDLTLYEDGTVVCVSASNGNDERDAGEASIYYPFLVAPEKVVVVDSLGVLIYKALDWSLSDDEERVLSPPLEQLIEEMVLRTENQPPGTIAEIVKMCENRLQNPSKAAADYQAVSKALFAETQELRNKLNSIKSAKTTLKLEDEPSCEKHLETVYWSRAWFQLMKEVRSGVKLRNFRERRYRPLPIKPRLSPFKKILDDIKYKRYILHKVMVNSDQPRTPCDILLNFGLLRSLLKPATARKLGDPPSYTPCLHEMLMREIQSGVRLQPVSSDNDSQPTDNAGDLVQPVLGLQGPDSTAYRKPHLQHQSKNEWRMPEFTDLESEADILGLVHNCKKSGRKEQSSDAAYSSADMSTERVTPKPSSWMDMTPLVWHSIDRHKFQYPLQIRNLLGIGYEFVENEEFHYSSSLFIKELVCVCQTIAKREVGNYRMVKGQFCFFCEREFFFTWALTCHFCKKINLFRVLYEDVNPLPCMHLPSNYKPLAVRTAEAAVQAQMCRCGWEKQLQWDSSRWKDKVENHEAGRFIGVRPCVNSC